MTKNAFCPHLDVGELTFTHYCMNEAAYPPDDGHGRTHEICDMVIHEGRCPLGKRSTADLKDGNPSPEHVSLWNRVPTE